MRWIVFDTEHAAVVRDWQIDPAAGRAFHIRRLPYGLRITKLRQTLEAFGNMGTKPLGYLGGKEVGEGPYGITIVTFAAEDGSYLNLTVQRLAIPMPLGGITGGRSAEIEELADGSQLVRLEDHPVSGVLVRPDGAAIIASAFGKIDRPVTGSTTRRIAPPVTGRQLRQVMLHLVAQDLTTLIQPDLDPTEPGFD